MKRGSKLPRYHHLSAILSANQDILYMEEKRAMPAPENTSIGYLRGSAYYEKEGHRDVKDETMHKPRLMGIDEYIHAIELQNEDDTLGHPRSAGRLIRSMLHEHFLSFF